jgi:hypothetical protein
MMRLPAMTPLGIFIQYTRRCLNPTLSQKGTVATVEVPNAAPVPGCAQFEPSLTTLLRGVSPGDSRRGAPELDKLIPQ